MKISKMQVDKEPVIECPLFKQVSGESLIAWLEMVVKPGQLHTFKKSFENLILDPYFPSADGRRFRRFGQSLYAPSGQRLEALPHSPFYQERKHNSLVGGFDRHFDALEPMVSNSPVLDSIVTFLTRLLPYESSLWRVNTHQIRVSASKEGVNPAPEGRHSDGHDFLAILSIKRHNITGGANTIYDSAGRVLLDTQFSRIFDGVVLDDRVTTHEVSPIFTCSEEQGFRDVLIFDFNRQ